MTLREYLKENAVPYDLFSDLTEEEKAQSIIDVAIDLRKMHYEPVVYARWEDTHGGKYANPIYRCTSCKGKPYYKIEVDELGHEHIKQALSARCPHCGAKMGGDG